MLFHCDQKRLTSLLLVLVLLSLWSTKNFNKKSFISRKYISDFFPCKSRITSGKNETIISLSLFIKTIVINVINEYKEWNLNLRMLPKYLSTISEEVLDFSQDPKPLQLLIREMNAELFQNIVQEYTSQQDLKFF
jgi:hypothetical protein